MRYWKERGIDRYDMGGGGDYKSQYGGARIVVPWIRMSRNALFPWLREAGRLAYSFKQRIRVRSTTYPD